VSDPPTVPTAAPHRSRLPWAIFALLVAMLGATFWIAGENNTFGDEGFFIAMAVVGIIAYELVGTVVASRAPRNPIGWLLLLVGFTFELGAMSDEYVTYAFERDGTAGSFGAQVAIWLQAWIFAGITALPLILLLFPDGRAPTRRWRVVVRVAVATAIGTAVVGMFAPGPIDTALPLATQPSNPLGIDALEPVLSLLEAVFAILLLSVMVAAVVAIVVRWRRSAGVERQQIRLLALTVLCAAVLFAATAVVGTFGDGALDELGNALFIAFFLMVGLGIPLALAFTILRYRMYDLELVIRKTVRFAIVAVLIAVILGAVVVVAGGPVVGALVDDPGPESGVALGVLLGLLILPLWRLSRRIADRVVFGGRATPYEVLTEFSERMGEAYATDDVLPRMASILGRAVGADRADVWIGTGAERRRAAGWPHAEGPSAPGDDAAEVSYQGEPLGALSVVMPVNDPMDDAKRSLLDDLASQAGPVLHNVRLVEDLRESRRRIVAAQDDRARKLERDIHDGVQQQLVALAVKLRLADQLVDRDPARAHEALDGLQTDAGQALDDLRDLARGIYPPLLADKGLEAALVAQARKGVVPTTVEADGVGRYPREVESAVYFCALEALNNATKYAGASSILVTLGQSNGLLAFTIADDGRGFDPDRTTYGTGLRGMHDRLEAVGGSLQVEATPGQGVRVRGRLPVMGIA
jgi:signal transduction histidine kinase